VSAQQVSREKDSWLWLGQTHCAERGSRKHVSLLTRCAFSTCPGEEAPANPTEPGSCCRFPAGMKHRAWQQVPSSGRKLAAPSITQSILSAAHVPLPRAQEKLRARCCCPRSHHVMRRHCCYLSRCESPRRGLAVTPAARWHLGDRQAPLLQPHCFSSTARAPSPGVSLPELMEILYTWSWPLPKDTPALQRELLLTALCSADGCTGGDGGKEPRAIQQAAGQGEEHLGVLWCMPVSAGQGQENHWRSPASQKGSLVEQGGPQGPPITSGTRCKSRTHPFPGCPAPRSQP